MPQPSGPADDQLDLLISRIQSLSGTNETEPATQAPPVSPTTQAPSDPPVPSPLAGQNPAAGFQPPVSPPPAAALTSPAPQAPASQVPQTPPTAPAAATHPPRPATSQASSPPAQPRNAVVNPAGFQPNRDEPWRPTEPQTLRDAGVSESIVEAIAYRFLLNAGEAEGRRVAEQLQIPFRMVEPVLDNLKRDHHVAYKHATATNDYVYVLTESGRAIARNHMKDCTYFGACPVRLTDYIASVKKQTIEGQYPKRDDLKRAFSDLLINPTMLNRLGPAVASGRGMFLFGFPGNGKTSIAERVTGAFGKYIWVPKAIDIDGNILRVFDPMNHELAMPEASSGLLDVLGFDKRWVRIRRPTIVAGGELTMDMLEVSHNALSNISEAPMQMKSNCGTLVIDDFGRQKMTVDELLNRWIVPLEKRYDFLNMNGGKKIQVPFDQLVIFSTNLEPKDLVDDAFLRRIPYKIEVGNPPENDFRKLFEIMCRVVKIPYDAAAIDYLIKTHYLPINRPFRNCQPRDLLLQVRNYCLYNDLPVELKNEYFDFACDNYFSVM
ncbi:MAG: AAA family ATPase [Planctomycetota bacterium]